MKSGITPLTPAQVAKEAASHVKAGYFRRCALGLDVFANVLTGGNLGETLSSRSARAATEGKLWGRVLSKFLDIFESNHGAYAQVADMTRAEDVIFLEESSGNLPK